ncbi:uncharacterized protein LOC110262750 isoform X2 [Arachis ipaensis]|uniref:uncharacterized protein LOC110262750 isoform X2 n=1 Tax=Arachis ipaensis TaxID=130454 RepID=UPI000A2B43AC|nr:uncharacterized protein LOC110262750 isoform X2 [Arachis ipaensis]
MREERAAAAARSAMRGSRAVSRVTVREAIAVCEAIAVSHVVTVVAGFHHASSPPPCRAPCRRCHCSVTREGHAREETEPQGSSATERGNARQICHRRFAHRQTTSPSVKLSPSPLPEVVAEPLKLLAAIGAATG